MSLIRFFLIAFALFAAACSSPDGLALSDSTSAAPPEYAELLKKYATTDGVRYAAWHGNPADMNALATVVDFYATTRPPKDRDEALAWHINAYNAWVLHNILQKYPTKGPLDGETLFFHGNRIVISGKKTSLDHLEQKVIRPVFDEPRIHFAVNCASESCPPLDLKPFSGATLDADLERLTRQFINRNPQGIVVEGEKVRLSKIFEWYAEDFGGKDAVVAYANQFRDSPIPENAIVEFMDYSWKLNSAE